MRVLFFLAVRPRRERRARKRTGVAAAGEVGSLRPRTVVET